MHHLAPPLPTGLGSSWNLTLVLHARLHLLNDDDTATTAGQAFVLVPPGEQTGQTGFAGG